MEGGKWKVFFTGRPPIFNLIIGFCVLLSN